MEIKNEKQVIETMKILEGIGWQFNGYDRCNYEFVFRKENKVCEWTDYVALEPDSISFSRVKVVGLEFKYGSLRLNQYEIDLFMSIYNYMHEQRMGLPLDLAKHQKDYDRAYKCECGETYCTFENGVLSCCVMDDEE